LLAARKNSPTVVAPVRFLSAMASPDGLVAPDGRDTPPAKGLMPYASVVSPLNTTFL
jgi:hypothetical protein